MTAWRKVKTLGFVTLASSMALMAGAAHADYENALASYKAAKPGSEGANAVNGAIDLWQKSALAGDVRSARVLGDLYSFKDLVPGEDEVLPKDTGVVRRNMSEALAWYIIAATHDFKDYQQLEPEPEAVNARTVARLTIPEMRGSMKDEQVDEAQRLVIELLSSAGSKYDLLRLGKMHLEGNGLPKNNVEALKFLYLARSRGRGGNAEADSLIKQLEPMLAVSDRREAEKRAETWQPPVPQTFAERAQDREPTAAEKQAFEQGLQFLTSDYQKRGGQMARYYQEALRALGFYWGDKIDGNMYTTESKEAVMRFQYDLLRQRIIENRVPADPSPELTDEEKALVQDRLVPRLSAYQVVDLMRLAALREHPPSMYFYGGMLAQGLGVTVDGQSAIEMLTSAAARGEELGHYAAGKFYAEGIPSPRGRTLQQSYSKACYHLGQAVVLDVELAKRDLERYCSVPADLK